jgi:hypothetical protein
VAASITVWAAARAVVRHLDAEDLRHARARLLLAHALVDLAHRLLRGAASGGDVLLLLLMAMMMWWRRWKRRRRWRWPSCTTRKASSYVERSGVLASSRSTAWSSSGG